MHIVYLLQGYLHALGMARTAQVKRDARIGEAEAKRDSGIKVTFVLTIIFYSTYFMTLLYISNLSFSLMICY